MAELDVFRPFWDELFYPGEEVRLGKHPEAFLEEMRNYIARPEKVRPEDYGFNKYIAYGFARGKLYENEERGRRTLCPAILVQRVFWIF